MTAYKIPDEALTPQLFAERIRGTLAAHLGLTLLETRRDRFVGAIDIEAHHMAPNGFLHAGAQVTLADTCAGLATTANLRDGQNFTTVELKSNFFATVKSGRIEAVCTPVHRGRTTQVWDAVVSHPESGKRLSLFRCTQLVLS
ncbi:MAG: PaaI family thioesterase [Pseudomonadota bacterium]